jgi:hypothetical protein
MLMAAITLSLLSVSALFALGGFDGRSEAGSGETLVVDLPGATGSHRVAELKTVTVVDRPVPRPRDGSSARRSARRQDAVRLNSVSAMVEPHVPSPVVPPGDGTTGQPPADRQPVAPPTAVKQASPNLGDSVRQLGDGLSSTVAQTGAKLAEATAPLGRPVSLTVAQVFNIVAAVLNGATNGLSHLLGAGP